MIPPSEPGEPLRPADARSTLYLENPGVYLMKTLRVLLFMLASRKSAEPPRSYFTPNPLAMPRSWPMISHIADFRLLSGQRTEALMLEATLIKQHHPHYNILSGTTRATLMCGSP
jgi:excinuclease UvrABC nuclease subunit